ncbi:MAG TPA: hypothetical protein VI456_07435 [Polyangia bacterium]
MRKSLILSALFLFLLGALTAASSVGCDSVQAAFDCQQVCERYRDCYDSSYDVSGCEDRCRTNAANDPSVQQAADTCDSCIGDKSCISATFNCGGSCGAIVP